MTMRRQLALWGLGLLFVAGIVIAGSHNPWFPWPNVGGILLLGIAGAVATAIE